MSVLSVSYGIGPTCTSSGEPQRRERSRSRSACSGEPHVTHEHRSDLDTGAVGRVHERRVADELVGKAAADLAVEAQHVARGLDRMDDEAARHSGPDRMEAVLEPGDDAEVAASAAQGPEQIGVLLLAGRQDGSVGCHELDGDEVVDGQPVLRHQEAESPAEGQAGDPRRRDGTSRDARARGAASPG